MPRATRLEYEDAFYHVMSRGRARQTLFHDERYYHQFCQTLGEAHQRFGIVIHAYCLMGNHYHLLVQTPEANLSRVMRHINGVYTQRHNRLKRSDGPIFRGRFKSIVVDADAYLLQLSRYIHRNPIDTQGPLVNQLGDYPWSSYPAYINTVKAPEWLNRDLTYGMLGSKQRYAAYRNYVDAGVDEDIKRFYSKGNVASILGAKAFKEELAERKGPMDHESDVYTQLGRLQAFQIVGVVAALYHVDAKILVDRKSGKPANWARKVAMYACQRYGRMILVDIAKHFHVVSPGGVSNAIHHVRLKLENDSGIAEFQKLDKLMKVEQLS